MFRALEMASEIRKYRGGKKRGRYWQTIS